MKKRPLSIRLLAIALCLTPVGMSAELIYLHRIPLAQWIYVFNPELWNLQVLAVSILSPLVGLAVWTVRRWAYPVLVAWSGLVFLNNVLIWISGRTLTGLPERCFLTLCLLALVVLEVRKEFYAPYFNPRLRWWEQAHRFATDRIQVVIKEFGRDVELFRARSFDVSATGLFVVSGHDVAVGDLYGLDVILPDGRVAHATGEVVWAHGGSALHPQGFGCRFIARDRHFRAEVRHAIRGLRAEMRRDR